MVFNEEIAFAFEHHVVRRVHPVGVHVLLANLAIWLEFCGNAELVLPDVALGDLAVHFAGDSAVVSVDEIFHFCAGAGDLEEVAEDVV